MGFITLVKQVSSCLNAGAYSFFGSYGFIASKINTPKCTYVIHFTQNLSVRGLT